MFPLLHIYPQVNANLFSNPFCVPLNQDIFFFQEKSLADIETQVCGNETPNSSIKLTKDSGHSYELQQLLLSFLKHLLAHCQSAESVVSTVNIVTLSVD